MKKLMWVCCLVALWGCGEKSVLAPEPLLSAEQSLASTELAIAKKIRGEWKEFMVYPVREEVSWRGDWFAFDFNAGELTGKVSHFENSCAIAKFHTKLLPWEPSFPSKSNSFTPETPINFRIINPKGTGFEISALYCGWYGEVPGKQFIGGFVFLIRPDGTVDENVVGLWELKRESSK